jgi:DNA polymerase I-like protein with 3'-5' exonuclease and polymerase domains
MLTIASQDAGMLAVYGEGRPANDMYIFVGSQIPKFGEPMLALGYDPYNPTPEAIKACKMQHKKLRGISKTTCLAANYGAQVRKIAQTFRLQGIEMTMEEVQNIFDAYWKLFGGVRDYEAWLKQTYRALGYVIGPLGIPITFCDETIRLAINKTIQTSSHIVTQMSIYILDKVLKERKIAWAPFILDFHDECIFTVAKTDREAAMLAVTEVETRLQDLLKSPIKFKLSPDSGSNLAQFKIENYKETSI